MLFLTNLTENDEGFFSINGSKADLTGILNIKEFKINYFFCPLEICLSPEDTAIKGTYLIYTNLK
jgi:hypothetical protein